MPTASPILPTLHPLWVVALVTLLFAPLARAVRGVSLSGAIAGGVVCFVLYASAGFGAFVLLMLLFVLTWAATRLGYQRKQKLGTAEKKEGRTASQVLANVGGGCHLGVGLPLAGKHYLSTGNVRGAGRSSCGHSF
jgi:uncharacterized membrane protein